MTTSAQLRTMLARSNFLLDRAPKHWQDRPRNMAKPDAVTMTNAHVSASITGLSQRPAEQHLCGDNGDGAAADGEMRGFARQEQAQRRAEPAQVGQLGAARDEQDHGYACLGGGGSLVHPAFTLSLADYRGAWCPAG